MMSLFRKTVALLAVVLLAVHAAAGERIAVAEIRCSGGVKPADTAGFAEYIESRIGNDFTVVSRASLKSMLKEWEFNSRSGLVLPEEQKTELAQKSVSHLLVCSIARVSNRYSLTLLVVDPSTGLADPKHRASLQASSLSEIFRRLDSVLEEASLRKKDDRRLLRRAALLPAEAAAGVSLPPAALTDLTNKIGSFLLKSGSLELITREDLKKIAAESNLALSDLADPGALAKTGNVKIGDDLIIPRIIRFRNRALQTTTAISGTSSARVLIDISLQLRIVEVSTGKIRSMENIDFTLDSRNIDARIRRDWTLENYHSRAISDLAVLAGERTLSVLDPLKVAAAEGKYVYLSRGEGAGVHAGNVYQVFIPGKEILHPVTRQKIGQTERPAGTIRVLSVQSGFSTAERTSGKETIPPGAICRKLQKQSVLPEEEAPDYPAAN